NLGNPDTTAPYSASWDTTTAANGSHTLSAVATDSSGNTATSSGTVTVSNQVQTGVLLLGESQVSGRGSTSSAGVAYAYPFTAEASGTLASLAMYVDGVPPNLIVGIYSDAGGKPGTLLSSATLPVTSGWAFNSVAVPAASIVSGRPYWLAFLGVGSGVRYRDEGAAGTAYQTTSGGLSALPSTFPAATAYTGRFLSMYGSS
ncbi:MAG: hypothetical protein ACXVY8_09395, partial [Gaiellaceae bacterium]